MLGVLLSPYQPRQNTNQANTAAFFVNTVITRSLVRPKLSGNRGHSSINTSRVDLQKKKKKEACLNVTLSGPQENNQLMAKETMSKRPVDKGWCSLGNWASIRPRSNLPGHHIIIHCGDISHLQLDNGTQNNGTHCFGFLINMYQH